MAAKCTNKKPDLATRAYVLKKVRKEKRFSEKEGYFVGWLPDVTIDFHY